LGWTAGEEDTSVGLLVRHNRDVVRFKWGDCNTPSVA